MLSCKMAFDHRMNVMIFFLEQDKCDSHNQIFTVNFKGSKHNTFHEYIRMGFKNFPSTRIH